MSSVSNPLKLSWSDKNALKIVTRSHYDYQDERIALDGRIGRKKDGTLKKGVPDRTEAFLITLMKRRDDVMAMELATEKDVKDIIKDHPLWINFLKGVKGCGEMMSAVIITEFDIHKWENVSKGWQFAGMNPGMVKGKVRKKSGKIVVTDVDVRGDKRTSGYLRPYNDFLKAKLTGVLGASFIIHKPSYEKVYRDTRHRYESMDWGVASKNPTDKSKPKANHQHNSARRKMLKVFLQDLYVAWRTLEGLSVRTPYSEEYLGRKHHT